jgi:CDP-diacylglycerol--serine O-phosphatidyltransferase
MLRVALALANLITYLGAGLGAGAILLALHGEPLLALALATLVGLADLADGAWARRFKRDQYGLAFGAALDSLADMIGFVALPVVITVAAGTPWWLALPVSLIYVWAGLTRLAAYDAADRTSVPTAAPVTHYRGLPVTFAGLVLPLVGLIGAVAPGPVWVWCCGALVALAAGFVAGFRLPKLAPKTYPLFGLLALALIAGLVIVRG